MSIEGIDLEKSYTLILFPSGILTCVPESQENHLFFNGEISIIQDNMFVYCSSSYMSILFGSPIKFWI